MKGIMICTDGVICLRTVDEHIEGYVALRNAIDCDYIDIVHAVNLPEPYCMVVDDEALLKEEVYINPLASYLYGADEHGQPICGDVILMKDKITPDGVATVGLDEDDITKILGNLRSQETYEGVKNTIDKIKDSLK